MTKNVRTYRIKYISIKDYSQVINLDRFCVRIQLMSFLSCKSNLLKLESNTWKSQLCSSVERTRELKLVRLTSSSGPVSRSCDIGKVIQYN